MAEHTDEKTLDGHPIEHGMRVWDYDLNAGWIDLSDTEPHDWHKLHYESDELSLWFHVVRDKGGRSLMNAQRVWVRHPYDRIKA
jgi:hypothetical protein